MALLVQPYIQSMINRWVEKDILINGLLFYGSFSGFPSYAAKYFIEQFFLKHQTSISNNPNFLHVFNNNSLKINDIRGIQEYVQFGSHEGKPLIVFIEQIELLTVEAANSFLKTLETPPKNVFFILSSLLFMDVLPTIRSRCQHLYCPPLKEHVIFEYIKQNDPNFQTMDYHQMVNSLYDSSFSNTISFSDFLSFSFSEKLSFFTPLYKDKNKIKLILYDWLFDIHIKNSNHVSCLSASIVRCITALNVPTNTKLQLDSLISDIDSLVV